VSGRRADARHRDVDAVADDFGQCRRDALEGDVYELDARLGHEEFGGEVGGGALAAGAVGQRAGLRLGERDHVAQRLRRQARARHHDRGRLDRERHRHEVLERIVRQLRVQGGGDHVRAVGEHERVPVRRRLGDLRGADRAAGAAAILDHELVGELLRQLLRDGPRGDVGQSAGRERHHDADRLGRPGALRERRGRGEQASDGGEQQPCGPRGKTRGKHGISFVADAKSRLAF